MVKTNRILWVLWSILFITACVKSDSLYEYLENGNAHDEEISREVDLGNFFRVESDQLFIIGESNNQETIEDIINIPYKNKKPVSDSMNRLIFIKDSDVVYEIDIDGHEIYFDQNDKARELQSAIFKVIPEGRKCFLLKNIER